MPHFTVAVITEGVPTAEKIEKALAPFQENNMGNCPREYMEFHSLSKEYKDEYETGTTERVRLKDATLVYPWSDCLYEEVTEAEYEQAKANGILTAYSSFPTPKYKIKKDLAKIGAETVEIPWKELYSTFEEYLEDYHDATKDPETLDYGYWENPNAKWDWYQIGGRWAGMLKVHADCENCGTGEKSWGWGNENPYFSYGDYKKVDFARIKDLVFSDYQRKYDEAKRFWELVVEEQPPLNDADKKLIEYNFYKPTYYTNTYTDKETYAECEATFSTYAVIDKNGNWIAKGEMGFWGISTEEKNQVVDFIKNYKKNVFDNAGDDDYITIVDCHI